MKLYHVTTEASAKRILKEGLKPRNLTKKHTLYGSECPSVSQYCYMCTNLKTADEIQCFIQSSAWSNIGSDINCVTLQINMAALNIDLMRPDEDWLIDDFLTQIQDVLTSTDELEIPSRLQTLCNGHIEFDSQKRWIAVDDIRISVDQINRWCDAFFEGKLHNAFKCVELFHFLWPESIKVFYTVAYKGIVIPSAIVAVHDVSSGSFKL